MKITFESQPFKVPKLIKASQAAQVELIKQLSTFVPVDDCQEIRVSFTGSSWNMDESPRRPWFHEPRQNMYVSADIYSGLFRKGFKVKIASTLPPEKLYSTLKAFIDEKGIEEFALLLEKSGYRGAKSLIVNDLLPIAQKHHISLLASANRYANCDHDQCTSFYRLGQVLLKIRRNKLAQLDIHRRL